LKDLQSKAFSSSISKSANNFQSNTFFIISAKPNASTYLRHCYPDSFNKRKRLEKTSAPQPIQGELLKDVQVERDHLQEELNIAKSEILRLQTDLGQATTKMKSQIGHLEQLLAENQGRFRNLEKEKAELEYQVGEISSKSEKLLRKLQEIEKRKLFQFLKKIIS